MVICWQCYVSYIIELSAWWPFTMHVYSYCWKRVVRLCLPCLRRVVGKWGWHRKPTFCATPVYVHTHHNFFPSLVTRPLPDLSTLTCEHCWKTGRSLDRRLLNSLQWSSLANHTLQSQEKEGLVTMRIASCSADRKPGGTNQIKNLNFSILLPSNSAPASVAIIVVQCIVWG